MFKGNTLLAYEYNDGSKGYLKYMAKENRLEEFIIKGPRRMPFIPSGNGYKDLCDVMSFTMPPATREDINSILKKYNLTEYDPILYAHRSKCGLSCSKPYKYKVYIEGVDYIDKYPE